MGENRAEVIQKMLDSCGGIFHNTTAMGYCSRCGKTWKRHSLERVLKATQGREVTDAE
jgi:hypothetical protein